MKVGTLEIEMLANLARLRKDMDDAKGMVNQAMNGIEKSVNMAKAALSALGIGLGVGYFANLVKSSIDATAKMKDLAQEAGVTAERISRFEAPARTAGVGLDAVAAAMFKLNKAATEAKDPNSRAAQALNAIGISTAQLKNLKPDEMFELVARAAAKYGDGVQKNAVMTELFNKSGREMNRLVAELAESQNLAATTTNQQAEEADRLQDQMIELTMESEKLKRAFLADIVPAASEIVKAFAEAKKEGGLLQGVFAGIEASWQTMKGTTTEQLARINKLIATQRENVAQDPKHQGLLNDYLAERARLEKIIFDQELEAQNKRALAGAPGKPDPKFDPEAYTRAQQAAQAFRGELAALEKQLAGVVGQGEEEAYALKLQGDSFKNLTPYQKYYLQTVNDIIVAEKQNAVTRQELIKSNQALIEAQDRINDLVRGYRDALRDAEAELEFENSLIGKSADEIARLTTFRRLDLELRAKAAQLPEDASSEDIERLLKLNAAAKERIGILMDTGKAGREQLNMWEQFADAGGRFFADLAMNGRGAFDRLKQSLKSFAAEILALFAKKYILQMIAGVTGSTALDAAASAVGAGTAAGGIGGAIFGSAAAGTGIAGAASNFAMGFSAPGVAAPGLMADMGAALAGMGPVGWAILAALAVAAVANVLRDKENPRAKLGFGADAQGYVSQGVFGAEGYKYIETNDSLNQTLRDFMKSFRPLDEKLAKLMTPDQFRTVQSALSAQAQREFSFPPGDSSINGQLTMEYVKQKYSVVFADLDKTFADFVKNFTGSTDDLVKAILAEASLLDMLNSPATADMLKRIPELTVDGLRKVQAAGEALSDTFTRVVNEFLTAQANLNAAIGARNPGFARDLILGQRNAIGGQFASLIGQSYGNDLAMQMALNPQSFTGLGTQGMTLLAQWLGLQTQLEQLDSQLAGANSATDAITTFSNAAVDAAAALISAKNGLAQYLRNSLLSDLSPLSPQARYAEARRQYEANLALAQGGDIAAIGNFGASRDAFLNASRAVNASSSQYNADFFSSYNAGAALTNGAVRPYTAADATINTNAIVGAISATASGQQVTNTILVDYLNELANGNTAQSSARIVELLSMLNDRVRINGGALTSDGGALA